MNNDDLIDFLVRDENKLREAAEIIDPDWEDDYVSILHDRPKDFSILDFAQEIVTEGIEEHRDELERLVAGQREIRFAVTVRAASSLAADDVQNLLAKIIVSGVNHTLHTASESEDPDEMNFAEQVGSLEILPCEHLDSPVEKSVPVTCVSVTDPETRLPVELEIRKLTGSGAMVGIDASYLEQDVDAVRNPYNSGTIEIPDDER